MNKSKTMKSFTLLTLVLFLLTALSACTSATDQRCEMPPGIDDGKTYWIKFKSESKMYAYKIEDTRSCWIKIWKEGGNHYWYPIEDISVMTSIAEDS